MITVLLGIALVAAICYGCYITGAHHNERNRSNRRGRPIGRTNVKELPERVKS
jgi:hypothetical protein